MTGAKHKTKICSKCDLEKEADEFYKHKRVCKVCLSEHKKEYRKTNKKERSEKSKIWYHKTKESRKEHKRLYMKNKRETDELFALRESTSRLIRMTILRGGFKKDARAFEILGCSYEEFMEYLESKFESWMNWENRGKYNGEFEFGWDIDHIIPASSAKTKEDIFKLNHYTNLQPLCSKINREVKKENLEY